MTEPDTERRDDPDSTRRLMLGGAGLAVPVLLGGAVAASAQTPQAQTPRDQGASAQPAPRAPLSDPRQAHPRPPFASQDQDWPALASRMEPRPDHGERSYRGSGRLAGRKALITGGDSGIGRAAAIAYAREGADVAINYLEAEEADAREVVELIRQAGRKAVPIPGDIRDEAFCRRLVDEAARELGGMDILVNNAARQAAQASIADITTQQFDDTMRTNLYAMFWITKAALPHLPAGASIINVASVVAYDPPAALLDYSMTKAGMIAFSNSLAKQVAERGIRVNSVAPGPFWTPLQLGGGQLPGKLESFGADAPLGRPGQPAEIAPVFVMLASAEASFASGGVFGSTGGSPGP